METKKFFEKEDEFLKLLYDKEGKLYSKSRIFARVKISPELLMDKSRASLSHRDAIQARFPPRSPSGNQTARVHAHAPIKLRIGGSKQTRSRKHTNTAKWRTEYSSWDGCPRSARSSVHASPSHWPQTPIPARV